MRKVAALLATIVLLSSVSIASAAMVSSGNISATPTVGTPANSGSHGSPNGAGGGHHGGGYPGGGGSGGGHHHGGYGGYDIIYPYPYWPYPSYPYPYPYPDLPDSDTAARWAAAYRDARCVHRCAVMAVLVLLRSAGRLLPLCENLQARLDGYPHLAPPPSSGAPISDGSWEWCAEKKGYFPYVASCPHGWTAVPVTAPQSEGAADTPPTTANWFYCDDPKGYLPYVSDCKKDWRAVPSMPPPNANQGTK